MSENNFQLSALKDEEVVRVTVTTFKGATTQLVCAGKVFNTGGPDPFMAFLKEHEIRWSAVKTFTVETFDGSGDTYGREKPGEGFDRLREITTTTKGEATG